MEFDIGIWWHWLFIAAAMLGSAWHACRQFFTEYNAASSPFSIPFFRFFYELAGSFAGWMSLWILIPLVLECSGKNCRFSFSWHGILLLTVATLGISGLIPATMNAVADGIGHLTKQSV